MGRYVTDADMEVWCEKTIEEAPSSSIKTAAEHLLLSNRNTQRAIEVERSVTAELRAEAHQLRVNLHLERDRVTALEARATAAEARVRELEECIAALRAERDALRAAVEEAMGPLAIGASYADQTGITLGLRTHARDCAKALRTLTAALSPAPPRGSISTWCPECGPHVATDEDGCCTSCGATATGGGADAAVAALERAKKETEPCAE